MKIFNLKRIKAIQLNRVKNYLVYAIGEIILVVIGIVIGLQVNKWNEAKKIDRKIVNYYERINEEANILTELLEHNTKYSDSVIDGLTYCLKSLSEGKIDSLFKKNILFLTDLKGQTLSFPTLDDFIAQGYPALIQDYSFREDLHVLDFYRKQSEMSDELLQAFSETLLKPQLINKINYLKIDYYNQDVQAFDLKKIDLESQVDPGYEELINDMAFWNLIVHRIGISKDNIVNNKSIIRMLERIQKKTLSKINEQA